jgi:hypothetical protein
MLARSAKTSAKYARITIASGYCTIFVKRLALLALVSALLASI